MKRILLVLWAPFAFILLAIKGLFGVLGLTAVLHSSGIGILTGAGYIAGTLGFLATALAWLLWWPILVAIIIVGLLLAESQEGDKKTSNGSNQ